MARSVQKLSVNLSKEVVDAIRSLAERRRTTMTDVIRRGIGTEKYLQDVVDRGGKVFIEDRRGRLRQIVIPELC